jgi:hypothetical protein
MKWQVHGTFTDITENQEPVASPGSTAVPPGDATGRKIW